MSEWAWRWTHEQDDEAYGPYESRGAAVMAAEHAGCTTPVLGHVIYPNPEEYVEIAVEMGWLIDAMNDQADEDGFGEHRAFDVKGCHPWRATEAEHSLSLAAKRALGRALRQWAREHLQAHVWCFVEERSDPGQNPLGPLRSPDDL